MSFVEEVSLLSSITFITVIYKGTLYDSNTVGEMSKTSFNYKHYCTLFSSLNTVYASISQTQRVSILYFRFHRP